MNSDQPQPDVSNLDEDLVAYLDGELEDSASKRLEERLANDEKARERLRALAVSWDLLDNLPRTATDESFTRTTVELIAVEVRKEIAAEEAAIPARKRRRWIAGAAAALAAAMVGFVAVVVAWPDANERLLRDLPVVRNFELYEVAPQEDALDFLRQLETNGLFVGEAAGEIEAADIASSGDEVSRDELAARRALVEELSPGEKNELRKAYESFQSRPEEVKAHLRDLDRSLRIDSEGERLRAVLQSYHNWLPTLSPLERANLLKMSPTDAITEIQRLKQNQFQALARSGRSRQGPLKWRDADTIDRWLQERALARQDEILTKGTADDRAWFEGLSKDRKGRFLMALDMRGEQWPPKPPTLDEKEWQDLLNRLPAIKDLFAAQGKIPEEHESLKHITKKDRKEILDDISEATTLDAKRKLLFRWHRDAQRARMAFGGGVSPEELNRFREEELSEAELKELMAGPPSADEFKRRLLWAYFKRDFPPGWQPPFARGGGRRGNGGPDHGMHRGFDESRRGKPPPQFNRDDNERRGGNGRDEERSERQRRDRQDRDERD